MSVPGSSQIQFPSIVQSDFAVDQVTDQNGAPANVLDLDLGFTVNGHIDFPNPLSGTGNVAVYADQLGGGYSQKILSKDITITANPSDPSATQKIPWTLTYPTDLPATSQPLSILRLRLRRVRWCTTSSLSLPSTVCSRTSQRSWRWGLT